jgi:hypothetical protein
LRASPQQHPRHTTTPVRPSAFVAALFVAALFVAALFVAARRAVLDIVRILQLVSPAPLAARAFGRGQRMASGVSGLNPM